MPCHSIYLTRRQETLFSPKCSTLCVLLKYFCNIRAPRFGRKCAPLLDKVYPAACLRQLLFIPAVSFFCRYVFYFFLPSSSSADDQRNCVPPVPLLKKVWRSFSLLHPFAILKLWTRNFLARSKRHFSLNLLISNKLPQSHDRRICLSILPSRQRRHFLSFLAFICSRVCKTWFNLITQLQGCCLYYYLHANFSLIISSSGYSE